MSTSFTQVGRRRRQRGGKMGRQQLVVEVGGGTVEGMGRCSWLCFCFYVFELLKFEN